MPSFSDKKQLRFIITLDPRNKNATTFDANGNDTITLQGFRASIDIDKAGGVQMSTLRAKIYGVKMDDMNAATVLQWKNNIYVERNTIEVYAIVGEVETLVFAGNIVMSYGDFSSLPEVCLNIQAQSAFYNQLAAAIPTSIPGGIDVAIVMERIAKSMGLAFENNNVHLILANVYVASSLTEQAKELAQMCGFWLYIDDKTLAITNPYQPRTGQIPNISAESGLIGYPMFDGIGVTFQTLFNPAITHGGSVQLVTDLKNAKGQWIVTSVSHKLECEKPNGAWFSTVRGNVNGLAITK